jgi:hypothetical protein
MEIHKPKPWHGWREFLKEYLIIVVGVLTALGAEQTVEWVHRHEEIQAARAALHQEIAIDLRTLTLEVRDNECYERRAEAIASWARGERQRPPLGQGGLMSGVAATNWEMVKAGPVAHMALQERLTLAAFYSGIENQRGLIQQLRLRSEEIAGYLHRETLDEEEKHALVRLTGQAEASMHALSRNVPDLQATGRRLGIPPAPPRPAREKWVNDLCAAYPVPAKTAS